MKISFSLLLLICFTAINFSISAQSEKNISVKINQQSGDYSVASSILHWTFSGTIGQPVNDVKSINGKDAIGIYKEIIFKWKSNNNYEGSIRWYAQQPVIIFSLALPNGAKQAPVAFPSFTSFPGLHHYSFHNHIFPLPQFFLEETSTPWLLFNDNADACVISPASDFMVSLMTNNDSTTISSGLNREVKNLPSHFTHSTMMVMDNGIRKTWDTWGDALRALYKRKRPANDCDAVLKYFGYWTDNGADYYYHYDTTKGYAGTLLAVKKYYQQQKIPLGYMQLDSWWYEKSRYNINGNLGAEKKKTEYPAGAWNRSGGLMQYKADSFLFPEGLAAFQKKLGLPLITHSRWIDLHSPYHRQYKISGFAAIDTSYWKHIMRYLKNSGVIDYEQDWMNYIYMKNPEMISNVEIGNAFTDGMAHAAQEYGINLQYCMALPRYFMQGVKYNNLTTIRPSGDRFMPKRWAYFIFTSQLAFEMGIWPWCDVFKSNELDNMIVSVLSAGVVGTGDAIGEENKANILRACRNDGVLVKPDVPLLPFDKDYINMANGKNAPVLAYTYTHHKNIITSYVFAFADDTTTNLRVSFKLADIGMKGKAVVFDPLKNKIKIIADDEIFSDELPTKKYDYYIIAPVTNSGIAFLGDAGKIAATGKKRIADIISSNKNLQIKVLFAKGESSVTLRGYCAHAVIADKGKINIDAANHLFTLTLPAPENGNSVIVNLK